MSNQPDLSLYVAVFLGLTLFGIFYNSIVDWMSTHKYSEGFTSLLVAAGVLVTVAGCGFLIGWQAVGVVLLGFAFSGAPMVMGSVARYVRQRAESQRAMRNE